MEIQQLRYIVALSQTLNFRKASERVHVTQPTLSQQIKKLEEELGKPLFERNARNVRLTPEGEIFIPYAMRILKEMKSGLESVQDESDELAGTVRIGAIPTICPYLIPRLITQLSKHAPNIRLDLFEETTSVVLDSLKSSKLDMAVLALPVDVSGISTVPIGIEHYYLAVHASNPLSKKSSVAITDLKTEKMLILQEGHCFGDQSLGVCRIKRENPQVRFQGSSLTSVLTLAASDQGVTFIPEMAIPYQKNPKLKYVPFKKECQAFRTIGIATRTSAHSTRVQKHIHHVLESLMK